MSGKRACYHILQSNGPNNDFKLDDNLLEYCTWTDSDNNFYYLCKWSHSRYHSGVLRRYQHGYIVYPVEDPRLAWHEATNLYGYTRPERFFPPAQGRPSSCPSMRETLETFLGDNYDETHLSPGDGYTYEDDSSQIFLD